MILLLGLLISAAKLQPFPDMFVNYPQNVVNNTQNFVNSVSIIRNSL